MSRRFASASALQAAAAAVLVIGVLLLLVVSGHQAEEDSDRASGAGDDKTASGVQNVSDLELPDGFDPIPAENFFRTVTAAQKAAGSWRVVSTAESDGQSSPPANQDVKVTGSGVDVRIAMQGSFGPLEALWVDRDFYVKGLTARAKPWLKADVDGKVGQVLSSLVAYSDPAKFLGALREPARFQIVGVEDTDAGKAVHYRLSIDAETYVGEEKVTPEDSIEMDMWVDEHDRPVQVVTVSDIGGSALRSTLIYSGYGQDIDLAAPPKGLVTEKLPAGMAKRK